MSELSAEQMKDLLRDFMPLRDSTPTSRDLFAAAALQGLCANLKPEDSTEWLVEILTRDCWKLADAMLEAE